MFCKRTMEEYVLATITSKPTRNQEGGDPVPIQVIHIDRPQPKPTPAPTEGGAESRADEFERCGGDII